jgi:hypothetical protein
MQRAGDHPLIRKFFLNSSWSCFLKIFASLRLLTRLVADRLSVRWYLGYDLNEPLPDHSSLSRIRTRYGLSVFRRFFDAILEQCPQAKLIWGKELSVDSTKVAANASLDSFPPRFAVEARAALQKHLAALFPEEAPRATTTSAQEFPVEAAKPIPLPVEVCDQVRQELTARNEARQDWISREGRPELEVRRGTLERVTDFRVSTTDPDATLMPLKEGVHLGYKTHYVVDGGKARIILAPLVTPSEVKDNQPMLDLFWWVRFRWKLWPRQFTGDTVYGTIENMAATEQQGIRAYVPLPDYESRSPLYRKHAFLYDPDHDWYVCPNNAILPLAKHAYTEHEKRYQADPATCNVCPLKRHCTTSDQGRQVKRSFDEEVVDRVRAYHQTEVYHKAMRKRSVWVEPLFAEAKDWHGMRRFRLRRLWRVHCEALVIASGQNLKRLLEPTWLGTAPAPQRSGPPFR